MDGEKPSGSIPALARMGSPPHGRGKADPTDRNRTAFRITPAWAGKSFRCCRRGHCEKDHPRVGGEKLVQVFRNPTRTGSPPRGRGKASSCVEFSSARRITPAWAGKSYSGMHFAHLARDHPRGGGEKHSNLKPNKQRPRITPAWAGKSRPGFRLMQAKGDHPRVGGEKIFPSGVLYRLSGSPPRGRGKDVGGRVRIFGEGITPAWAGKSKCRKRTSADHEDHPRVGGEKHSNLKPNKQRPRITPAWAGKRLKRSHRSGIFISGPIPFHSVLHRPAGSGGSRAGRDGSPAGQPQNTGPSSEPSGVWPRC